MPYIEKSNTEDIPLLIALEEKVAVTHLYSLMLATEEWEEDMANGPVFLIKKDSVAVGSLSYGKKSPHHIHIRGVVVIPEFQGQGIARKVLTDFLAEHKNVERIDLVTHPDNTPALHLYQSHGFVIESRQENYYGDGEPRLVLVLKK